LSLDPSAPSRISLPCRQGRSRSPKNAELIGFNRSCRTRLPPTKLPLSLDPRQFVWLRPIAQSFVDRTSIISKSFNSGPSLRPVKPGQRSAFSGNNSTPTPQAVANVGEAASFCNPIGPAAHVFGSPFSPAPRKTGAKGRHLLFDSLRHERCRWRNELARAKPFATPSRHDRYFRIPTVWNRRKPVIEYRDGGGRDCDRPRRPRLIFVHQALVAGDIDRRDRGKATGGGHCSGTPALRMPSKIGPCPARYLG
jgi:hypothetical protein